MFGHASGGQTSDLSGRYGAERSVEMQLGAIVASVVALGSCSWSFRKWSRVHHWIRRRALCVVGQLWCIDDVGRTRAMS